MAVRRVLTSQTTNGSSTPVPFFGGNHMITVWGTFDGASVTVEVTHDSSAEGWVAATDQSGADIVITSPVNDELLRNTSQYQQVRLTVSGAGASTDLNAKILN